MADKVIQVNVTSTKSQRVSVSPGNVQNEISATPDSSQYYSNLAKNWAIASGLILNEDYSSKHYANESANSASSAKNYADASQATYTNVQNVANEALTNIEDARVDAVDNITTVKGESIASVEAKGNEVVSAVNEGIVNIEAKSNEANALVNTGIANINTTKTNAVNAVTTTKNNAVTEINKEVTDGKKELNDIIEAGGLNINDKITNCITEVPQNIKLELNNGTLTLKAGSKVIVPNGVGVFDEVTITQDINYPSLSHANADRVVFVNTSANALNGFDNDWVFSGSTAPSPNGTTYAWYDTTNNIVKSTSNSGSTWTTGLSLPICIGNYIKGSGFTSIDQVFNGCGVIGSTVWVDKGVKGLIPNGRNEDGSLNNIEYITSKVELTTRLLTNRTNYYFVGPTWPNVQDKQYYVSDIDRIAPSGTWVFNTTDNLIYDVGGNVIKMLYLGNGISDAEKLTSVDFKLPFRAVDYNEFAKSINTLSKAYITETYVSGTSGYRVWSDGYCEQWGRATLTNGSVTTVSLLKNYANINYNIHLEIRQDGFTGDKWMPYINAEPTVSSFVVKNSTSSTTILMWCTAGYVS